MAADYTNLLGCSQPPSHRWEQVPRLFFSLKYSKVWQMKNLADPKFGPLLCSHRLVYPGRCFWGLWRGKLSAYYTGCQILLDTCRYILQRLEETPGALCRGGSNYLVPRKLGDHHIFHMLRRLTGKNEVCTERQPRGKMSKRRSRVIPWSRWKSEMRVVDLLKFTPFKPNGIASLVNILRTLWSWTWTYFLVYTLVWIMWSS